MKDTIVVNVQCCFLYYSCRSKCCIGSCQWLMFRLGYVCVCVCVLYRRRCRRHFYCVCVRVCEHVSVKCCAVLCCEVHHGR